MIKINPCQIDIIPFLGLIPTATGKTCVDNAISINMVTVFSTKVLLTNNDKLIEQFFQATLHLFHQMSCRSHYPHQEPPLLHHPDFLLVPLFLI